MSQRLPFHDQDLLRLLRCGVPTGAISALPSSHQWAPVADAEPDTSLDLALCQGNWKQAEDHPDVVQRLIDQEVEAGWVVRTNHTPASAKQAWPAGVAIGKLNVVFVEGKEPRLVLDSSVCQVNTRCTLPERVAMPLAFDLKLAHCPADPPGAFLGASFDFKAAHKQVQVHPSEHGLLLFSHRDVLYHYRVCHFGGRFSAYWWQRFAATLLRLIHGILAFAPHRAWLYVDDLLAELHRPSAPEQLTLMTIFLQAILAPMSWRKVHFGNNILWCGWQLNLDIDTISLAQNKLAKLQSQLQDLLASKKIPRKGLEQTLGLLVWATSISPHLRPRFTGTSTARQAPCTLSPPVDGGSFSTAWRQICPWHGPSQASLSPQAPR